MLCKNNCFVLKILFHLNVPSNSSGKNRSRVDRVALHRCHNSKASSNAQSLANIRPSHSSPWKLRRGQGWIRKTAQYQYDKVKSNMLHLGQPTVWMLPVRSSTTYTKGQQNHLTLKMGTSHIHLVIPGQAKSSHEACDTPWPWGFLYLVLRDHRRCLVTFAQFGSRMHHQTGSHQVISCRIPVLWPPTHFPLLVANWDSAAVVPQRCWIQKRGLIVSDWHWTLCCRTFLGIVTVSQACPQVRGCSAHRVAER